MNEKILIVIVTFNSENFVERCLFSIANQNYKNFVLILVDNASADKTVEIVRNYRNAESRIPPSNFKFIRLSKNIGFSGAVNHAVFKYVLKDRVKDGDFDFILLLNPDMILDDSSIQNLLSAFSEKESDDMKKGSGVFGNVGAAGGIILDYDSDNIQHLGGFMLPNFVTYHNKGSKEINIEKILNNDNEYRRSIPVMKPDYVTGAFFLTPFNLFKGLGGLDAGYRPAYFEELDYCIKLKKAGFDIVLEPSAFARHFEGASSKKFSSAFYYYYHKNRIRCAIVNSGFLNLFKVFFYYEPKWLKRQSSKDQIPALLKAYLINTFFCPYDLLLKIKNLFRLHRIKKI